MVAPIRHNQAASGTSDPFLWDVNVVDFKGYNGSPNLKKSGVSVNFTQEMVDEWIKCAKDPIYFCENYIRLVHVDHGLIPFEPYEYQKEIISKFNTARNTIVCTARQSGKTSTAVGIILHYVLFNQHKTVALLANKADAALEIMSRIQLAYEYLPKWIQSGILEWNKGSIELENGCKIIASATSGSAIRGKSINICYIDETAFVNNSEWEIFFSSVYPTMSSGKNTKMLLTSCVPKGTFVITNSGICTIDKFIDTEKEKFYEIEPYKVYGHGGLRSGNTFYNNGKAETRILRTKSGEVEASLPHRFFGCTKEGVYKWIETKDIRVGDYIIEIANQQCFGDERTFTFDIPKETNKRLKNILTKEKTNDVALAYFLGLLLAEGYVYKNIKRGMYYVIISCGDDMSSMLNSLGLRWKQDDPVHYRIMSKNLVEFIESIGIDINKKAPEKTIPDIILTAPKHIQAEFIKGFFDGDGCARITSSGKVNVTIGLSSKTMLLQLKMMLLNFGIFSNYYDGYKEASVKEDALVKVGSYYYRLEIVGSEYVHRYFDQIGFGLSRKQAFSNHLQPRIDSDSIVPFSKQLLINSNAHSIWKGGLKGKQGSLHLSTKTLNNIKETVIKHDYYGVTAVKHLYENFVSNDIRFVEVKNITASENDVYDFSLPHDSSDFFCHSVLYNGMLGHQTPNGLNHFYKFWVDATEGRNGFEWVEVTWDKVPGRDENWKQETLRGMNHNYEKFEQEFNCQFLGSSGTLISGSSLKSLVHKTPIYEWDGFSQYVAPVKDRSYIMTCDVSRGKGLDYSAFSVIDITKMPYEQVATYKSNVITPTDYAHVINKIGILYNTAGVLVENNDIGGQVADMLFNDLDYDNLLFTTSNGRSGKVLCGGGSSADPSIRTTTPVKAKGCSVLKLLIEQQQLIINDFNTINELSRFSKKGKSYEAEDGNDDMVMSLVLFSWCTTQPYFSNLTDVITLHNLRDNDAHLDDFLPFGFIVDGREDEEIEVDNEGNMWKKTEAWAMNY